MPFGLKKKSRQYSVMSKKFFVTKIELLIGKKMFFCVFFSLLRCDLFYNSPCAAYKSHLWNVLRLQQIYNSEHHAKC